MHSSSHAGPPPLGVVILAAGSGTRLGGVAKATLVHDGRTYLERILSLCDALDVGTRIVVVGPPYAGEVRAELERIARAQSRASLDEIPAAASSSGVASRRARTPSASGSLPGGTRPNLHVVDNPRPERGMASSVSLGFAELERVAPRMTTGAFLWPVDHPFVREQTLRDLIQVFVDTAHATTIDPDVALAETPNPDAETGSDPSFDPLDTEVVRPRYGDRGGHPPLVGRAVWSALAGCMKDPQGARGVLAKRRTRDILVEDAGVVRDVDTPADLDPR